MTYADYGYYLNEFNGDKITEERWLPAIREADAFINMITFERLKNAAEIPNEVMMAACAVAEAVCSWNRDNAAVVSENVDGYSVNYMNATELEAHKNADMLRAADIYLPRSNPLRYRGVYNG